MKTKILIVDDYGIFRKGLKLLLEENENLEVIGEAGNSRELFEILSQKKPNVILLDLMFLQKNIVSLCKEIKQISPNIPFIIISVNKIENTLIECIVNGASGFLWKDSPAEELVKAIHKVVSGERYFVVPESQLFEKVVNEFSSQSQNGMHGHILSEREIEVVKHFANGKTYKQIADEMDISPRTVESHKNNILLKLNLTTTAELVKYAIKNQLIKL